MAFKLNNIDIKTPTSFSSEYYKITKSNRLSSGKMSMELIAKKRKFFLTYAAIDSDDLQDILDIIYSDESFFDFTFLDVENNSCTVKVYVGAIKKSLHRSKVYKDVSFNLIEQ